MPLILLVNQDQSIRAIHVDVLHDTLRMEMFVGASLTGMDREAKTYYLHRYAGRNFYLEGSSNISPDMVGRLVSDISEAWPRAYDQVSIDSRLVSPNNYNENIEIDLSSERIERIMRDMFAGPFTGIKTPPEKPPEPEHAPTAYERLVSDDD